MSRTPATSTPPPSSTAEPTRIAGLVLAAGSGRRYGSPKALVDTGSGPWVLRALDVLAGCDELVVVVGAAAEQVSATVGERARVVRNPDHRRGMASSLVCGLQAVSSGTDAVLVTLVDLPDVTAEVAARVRDAAGAHPRGALVRASYRGRPGHPVIVGADHLAGMCASLAAGDPDSGGAQYLRAHDVTLVPCEDLADGTDVDSPPPAAPSGSDR